MKNIFSKIAFIIFISFLAIFHATTVFAENFSKDISIATGDVKLSKSDNILKGDSVRFYVTVHNNSNADLSGVVKFYDEKTSTYLGTDQPVSVLTKKTDDVYMDWNTDQLGEHTIAIRVVPWQTDGDDPNNNKVTKTVYVDIDSDGDGIGDRLDNDDDNDGAPDSQDAFPLNPKESADTDKDGTGNNADTDDDNDGTLDMQDVFPQDPKESKDTDNDSVGDNSDPFPYDPAEWKDSDSDGLGDNADPDDANKGPIPVITIGKTGVRVNEPVSLNALKSRDPDGQVTKYEWDFGDGTKDTGVIIDHIFKKSGDYIVTLKATDDKGEPREQQIQIKVRNYWLLIVLIITTIALLLMLLGLFIPNSRFYYKKLIRPKRRRWFFWWKC